ncbi:hypothetical protein KNE206_45020 [Kitasatospora sp. NE20-6]|uniref:hypothetical protein n=1 Tax=Kitasatospora sp. NE20-6 TaxID=2859066 RepID=UPI0034DBED48
MTVPAPPSRPPQPPQQPWPLQPVRPPRPAAGLRRPGGRGPWWRAAVAVVCLAVAASAAVLLTRPDSRAHRAGSGGPAGPPPAVSGAHPGPVLLDGVSGRLEIAAGPGPGAEATATYVPEGRDTFGHVEFGPARPDGALPVRCATDDGGPVGPCHGLLQLSLPAGTPLTVRQSSGEISLSGLDGDLDLSLASVRFTAVGLHPERAALAVRSGSADLAFTAPPRTLSLDSVSASVALRLPAAAAGDAYAFTSDAVSADVRIALPDRPGAAHQVRLRTESASVAVLPAG